jgi:hypothetical protein
MNPPLAILALAIFMVAALMWSDLDKDGGSAA